MTIYRVNYQNLNEYPLLQHKQKEGRQLREEEHHHLRTNALMGPTLKNLENKRKKQKRARQILKKLENKLDLENNLESSLEMRLMTREYVLEDQEMLEHPCL